MSACSDGLGIVSFLCCWVCHPQSPTRRSIPHNRATHTSFSFQGQAGRLSVIRETRSRGTGYWYAYRSLGQRPVKRYLGQTSNVTIVHLKPIRITQLREKEVCPLLLTKRKEYPAAGVANDQRDKLFSERAYHPLFPCPFCVPGPSRQACPRQIATVTQESPAEEHLSPGAHSPHRTETQGHQRLPPSLCPGWSMST